MSGIRNLFRKFRPALQEDVGAAPLYRSEPRWVIVGLGNPGEEYARSRHNIGFRVIDLLAKAKDAGFNRRKFKGLVAEAEVAGKSALLVKPQTYYNLSGECVGAILDYYKIPVSSLIVVHDELDLEAGRLRLKQGGSDAGNRGVRSVAESLGSPDFIRVRVGIGRLPAGLEGKEYVLQAPAPSERQALDDAAGRARQAVEAIISDGLERAMGRFNQRG